MTRARDTYLRFKNPASVLAFFRRAAVKAVVGNLFHRTEADRVVDIRWSVAHVIVKPNTVVIAPGTYDEDGNEITAPITDPRIWVVLRFMGDALGRDEGPGSRWAGSVITQHIRNNGTPDTKRGVRMARLTWANKWVEVYHGPELTAAGIVPHVIAGGPYH